jgi:hypothetical protein
MRSDITAYTCRHLGISGSHLMIRDARRTGPAERDETTQTSYTAHPAGVRCTYMRVPPGSVGRHPGGEPTNGASTWTSLRAPSPHRVDGRPDSRPACASAPCKRLGGPTSSTPSTCATPAEASTAAPARQRRSCTAPGGGSRRSRSGRCGGPLRAGPSYLPDSDHRQGVACEETAGQSIS